jgi:hypothetical protein
LMLYFPWLLYFFLFRNFALQVRDRSVVANLLELSLDDGLHLLYEKKNS